MWLARSFIIPYLLFAIANSAYIDMGKIEKKAIAYVTIVTTVDTPTPIVNTQAITDTTTNQIIQQAAITPTTPIAPPTTLTTQQTAEVQTPATENTGVTQVTTAAVQNTPETSNSSAEGIGSWFARLFGLDSGPSSGISSTTTTSVDAANIANTAATTQPVTSTTTSSSNSSGGLTSWLASILGLGGSSSSSSSSSTVISIGTYTSITNTVSTSNTLTASTNYSEASSTTSSSTGSSSSDSGSNSGSGAAVYAAKSKGITYSPYTKSNSCKSASEVASDIDKLSDYSLIRLYSVDCSGIENVLSAMTSSQKLFLGVWNIDSTSVQNDLQTMKSAVESSSRGWSAVHTVSIGNEQVNSGLASVSQVAAGVQTARQWFKSNAPDYNGYIVTVDTYNQVIANPDMCDISDYIAVNCHPFFTGNVQPSETGPWLVEQINSVSSACGGSKSVLITETGWPTQGDSIGSCVPSESNQLAAFKSLVGSAGSRLISFTMYNDYWKNPGQYDVEQHWGVYGDPSV